MESRHHITRGREVIRLATSSLTNHQPTGAAHMPARSLHLLISDSLAGVTGS
jgi:hypothetical protein